jgi:hypothetical protein
MGNRKKTDLEVLIDALPILQKCGVSSVQVGEIAFRFGVVGAELKMPEGEPVYPSEYWGVDRSGIKPEDTSDPKDWKPISPKSDPRDGRLIADHEIAEMKERMMEHARQELTSTPGSKDWKPISKKRVYELAGMPDQAAMCPEPPKSQDLTSETNPDTIVNKTDTATDDSITDDGDELDFYAT